MSVCFFAKNIRVCYVYKKSILQPLYTICMPLTSVNVYIILSCVIKYFGELLLNTYFLKFLVWLLPEPNLLLGLILLWPVVKW